MSNLIFEDMYVIIEKTRLRSMGDTRFHQTMPDGRMIVSVGDLRSFGCLNNVDIVMTKRELDDIIAEQKASGLYPEVVAPNVENQDSTATETLPKEPATDPVVDVKPIEQSNTTVTEAEKGGKI